MKSHKTEVVVIGAGTAGLNAIRVLEKEGRDWILVESGPYGTTCARVGCMPSKLLIAAADHAHAAREAGVFGILVEGMTVDGAAVMKRLQRERDRFVAGAVEDTLALPADRRLCGNARFTGPSTLSIDDTQNVEFDVAVVATGASPFLPPPFDAALPAVLTTDQLFELDTLPASIAVVGMGAVGLEIGQALGRLGVDVTFFNKAKKAGPLTDPVLQAYIQNHFDTRFAVHANAEIVACDKHDQGATLSWCDNDGERHSANFELVLVAAGRRPNIEGLDLAAAGVKTGKHGMPADWDAQTTQCGNAAVFIAGDCNDHRPLLHEASDEGRIAGENAALHPSVCTHTRRTQLAIVFTHPQMAIAGQSFASLQQDDIEIVEVSYENQGRARIAGENVGLARLYAMKKGGEILGAEMFGPDVEHLAHLMAWSIQQGGTVKSLLAMPFYHPVVEEGLRTALRRLAKRLQVEDDCRIEDFASAAGM